jgi:hypothetical protein
LRETCKIFELPIRAVVTGEDDQSVLGESLLFDGIEYLTQHRVDLAQHYKLFKAKSQPWVPADSGFVCSLEDVESFLEAQAFCSPVGQAP